MEDKISEIILALTKTVKALQMYGIDHPSFKNFYTSLYQKIGDFLGKHLELTFQIERFTIRYEDRVVYEEEEKDINIAFRLFRDGIRSIGFGVELTSDELLRFLRIITQSSKDYDIALSLWESDFAHINFYVVEEEDESVGYKIPDMPVENIDYDAHINEMIKREKLDINMLIHTDLGFDELKSLKAEILRSQKDSLLSLTIVTLINFLNVERFEEIVESLVELCEQCVDNRDFYNARRIIHNLSRYPDINVIGRLENEITILGFKDVLNTTEDAVFDEFIAFIGFLSKKSISYFLKMMADVKRQDRLEALRQRIVHIAAGDTTPFIDFLKSDDITTVTNAVGILGIIKSQDTAPLLQPLFNHNDPKVRAEVVMTLARIKKTAMITQFINDPSVNVRVKAVHALSQNRFRRIYDDMFRRVKKKDFRDLDFAEQKEYFNYLVANGGGNLVKHLKKMLFKWLLFGRNRYMVIRRLSATALAQIETPEALSILRQGTEKNNRDIRTACEAALKGK